MVLSRLHPIVTRYASSNLVISPSLSAVLFLNVQKYKNAESGGGGPVPHAAVVCVVMLVLELPDHKSI